MSNKFVKVIFVFLIAAVLLYCGLIVLGRNYSGSAHNFKIEYEKNIFAVSAKTSGAPTRDFDFEVTTDYDLVSVGLNVMHENVKIQYPDYESFPDVKVFGKDLKCVKNRTNKVVFLYKHSDEVYISITFENHNTLVLEDFNLYDEILNNKDLNDVLSFKIIDKTLELES